MKLIYITIVSFNLLFVGCLNTSQSSNTTNEDHDNIATTEEDIILTDTIADTQVPFDVDKFIAERNEALNESKADKAEAAPPKVVTKKKIKPKKVRRPKIEFEQEVFELGELVSGDKIEKKFNFKNVGTAPLNIEKAEGTCGCTIPSYPFLALEPGDKGVIGVTYNSVGKIGRQEPEILVYSDDKSKPITKLKMIIEVIEKPSLEEEKVDSTSSEGR